MNEGKFHCLTTLLQLCENA